LFGIGRRVFVAWNDTRSDLDDSDEFSLNVFYNAFYRY
jgi:hypothetical protein